MKASKLSCQEVRQRCREAYREEQDLPKVRWAAFQEQRRREDFAAMRFEQKQKAVSAKTLRPNRVVDQFVKKLRRCLDRRVREVGGTEFSVLRNLFLERDVDCSGNLDVRELVGAMATLGLKLGRSDAEEIVAYYSVGKNRCAAMMYEPLVEDVERGSLHFLSHPTTDDMRPKDGYVPTPRRPLPPLPRRFVKKLRKKLLTSINKSGEYERILIRRAFLNWDADASGKLDVREFVAAMRQLGMVLTEAEAGEVVACYDPHRTGEISYEGLVDDVCGGVPHFTEFGPDVDVAVRKRECVATRAPSEADERADEALVDGMFTRRPKNHKSAAGPSSGAAAVFPNAVAEAFKRDLERCLTWQLKTKAGTPASILRDAFLIWDADASGKLNVREFRGAMARVGAALGLALDDRTAAQIVAYYDRSLTSCTPSSEEEKAGPEATDYKIHYKILLDDVAKSVPHFITHPTTARVREEAKMMMAGSSSSSTFRTTQESSALGILMMPEGVRAAVTALRDGAVRAAPRVQQKVQQHQQQQQQQQPPGASSPSAAAASKKPSVQPRDLLHGSLLRVDRAGRGTVTAGDLDRVLRELRITDLDSTAVKGLISWYAADGTGTLPYKRLVDDAFGPDALFAASSSSSSLQSLGSSTSKKTHDAHGEFGVRLLSTARSSSRSHKLNRIAAEKDAIERRLRDLQQEQKETMKKKKKK